MSTAAKVFLACLTLAFVVFTCGFVLLIFGTLAYPGWAYGRPVWEEWGKLRGEQVALATSEITTGTDTTTTTGDTGQDAQAAIDTTCRDPRWLAAAFSNTKEVSELLSVLDRDFTLLDGGQWSERHYTVPASSVFWTDLYDNRFSLPQGVTPLRVKGGWGIYLTTNPFNVPPPNYGGRWTRLCGPLTGVTAEIEDPTATDTASQCLIPDLDGMSMNQAIDVMDQWFEDTGYLYGKGFDPGDTIPSGSVFWTDMGEGFSVPSFVTGVAFEGNYGVFHTTGEFTSPSGGRLVICN